MWRRSGSPLVWLVPLFYACTGDHLTKPVIRVGQVSVSAYEVKKNRALFTSAYRRTHGHDPGEDDLRRWTDSFVDRTYFLADAYAKGYDTLERVNREVRAMEHLIVSEPLGLLEKRVLQARWTLTEEETTHFLALCSRRVAVDYRKFRSVQEADAAKGGLYGKAVLQWPFRLLGGRMALLDSLARDSLTPPVILPDGVYILRLVASSEQPPGVPPDTLRSWVVHTQTLRKREQVREEYVQAVRKTAGVHIDQETLEALGRRCAVVQPKGMLDKGAFADLLSRTIMTYSMDGSEVHIPVEGLIDFYNDLPLRPETGSTAQLVSTLEYMVYDRYAYKKAEELGILKEPTFILDRENYKKNVIFALYQGGVGVSEAEIKERYLAERDGLVEASCALVKVYTFEDRNGAMLARMRLRGVGATALQLVYGRSPFPDSVTALLLEQKIGEVPLPLEVNGRYVLVVKESESGVRTLSLEEARDRITKEIAEEKMHTRLSVLKTIYPLKTTLKTS